MNICFILEKRNPPRLNSVFKKTFALLENKGHTVSTLCPEDALQRLDKLKVEADLYLLKSDTELALSLGVIFEQLGARVLNSSQATMWAKDKVSAATILRRAGIPAPRSLVAGKARQLQQEVMNEPLILKSPRGFHGAGVHVTDDIASLETLKSYDDFIFAQKYLGEARKDLKIYVIGDHVFGIREESSPDGYLHIGEHVSLSDDIYFTSRRCGKVFGLDMYGLDIAEEDGRHYVMDVNYFPGYRGVPDAPQHLAGYILEAASA